jgi:ABC-2 type transport system ATP-binding protein
VHALEVEGLEVRYGGRAAVRGLHLVVSAGEVYGLLGPNGAGKTSTLAAVEGLRRPSAGVVRIAGVDMAVNPLAARACLGVTLQRTAFPLDLTAAELVRLFGALYGVRASGREVRAHLQRLGLEAEADRRPDALSAGQRQRLALALAVVHRPRLVVLDEPTTGLDPASRRQLWQLVRALAADGVGVLFTTHAMEEAAALSDRIGILRAGSLVAEGAPSALVAAHPAAAAGVAPGGDAAAQLEEVFLALTQQSVGDRASAPAPQGEGAGRWRR